MGYMATVVVSMDALHEVENDPKFGEKLARAIFASSTFLNRQDVSAGCHANAATVLFTQHGDYLQTAIIGGGYGTKLGYQIYSWKPEDPVDQLRVLQEAAGALGYRLQRKPKKKSA